jgi:hypothetical protein
MANLFMSAGFDALPITPFTSDFSATRLAANASSLSVAGVASFAIALLTESRTLTPPTPAPSNMTRNTPRPTPAPTFNATATLTSLLTTLLAQPLTQSPGAGSFVAVNTSATQPDYVATYLTLLALSLAAARNGTPLVSDTAHVADALATFAAAPRALPNAPLFNPSPRYDALAGAALAAYDVSPTAPAVAAPAFTLSVLTNGTDLFLLTSNKSASFTGVNASEIEAIVAGVVLAPNNETSIPLPLAVEAIGSGVASVGATSVYAPCTRSRAANGSLLAGTRCAPSATTTSNGVSVQRVVRMINTSTGTATGGALSAAAVTPVRARARARVCVCACCAMCERAYVRATGHHSGGVGVADGGERSHRRARRRARARWLDGERLRVGGSVVGVTAM